ncbi:response regulator [Paenibacillus sp. YIM B09110]|uniref:response regulator n=1 Tax=Paenibacillus sp. YIM B09110 TaxID=3126102 RepID=UPI00301E0D0A
MKVERGIDLYKVLIVDDEVLARVGIKSFVQWNEAGFEVVGEAENGEKALALIHKLQPDIVITDIHMPVMNGIELIKAAKAENLSVKFVVLSAYNDFEYVKEAMKLGASDYILKLEMESDTLTELLNHLKEKIMLENALQSEKEKFSMRSKENISAIKEKLFKEMVFGHKYSNAEFKEQLERLHIELPQHHLGCMILHPDNKGRFDKKDIKDVYLLDFAIMNIINEILIDYQYGVVFCSQPEEYVIIFSAGEGQGNNQSFKISDMDRIIRRFLKEYLNISVSIGISNVYQKYSNLQSTYQEALYAVNQSFNYPPGSTIEYRNCIPNPGTEDISIKLDLKELEKQLEATDLTGIETIFLKITNYLHGAAAQITREYLKATCAALLLIITSYLDGHSIGKRESWNLDPYKQLEELKTHADYIAWIEHLKALLLEALEQTEQPKRMIGKAMQFVNQYYMENISLETTAEHIHISANYLSAMFKKEAGINFIDYVTNVRIEAAKKLIKAQKYKIYEVSQLVGYENEHYFSRVFKKVTGMSPIKFRG